MRLRFFTYALLSALILLAASQITSAQALDISSGGLPTITGAVGGSVTGNGSVTNDLVVTINFGEVSPLNTNSIVKVVVPIALRSNQPYQVAVSMSGLNNANAQAVQASDVGFGLQNIRVLGAPARSAHKARTLFNLPSIMIRRLPQQSEPVAACLIRRRSAIYPVRPSF